jgi:hypothetical protein
MNWFIIIIIIIIIALRCVTYKMDFGLDDWIYCPLYIHTTRDYRQYSAITFLHTFQFTVAHALGFSVFASRILATGLSQTHCHNNSHMKSFCNSLIPFLPFLLNHLRLPSRHNSLDYCSVLPCTPSHLLTVPSSARTPQKTPSCIVKNACLLVRYVAMDILLSRARVLREYVYRLVA